MQSVLVTGGFGHLGLYTAREIVRRGDRAVLFDVACKASLAEQNGEMWGDVLPDRERPYWFNEEARNILGDAVTKVVAVRGDILDVSELIDVIRRFDITRIVNSAALFNPTLSFQNPMESFRVNCMGAVSVFEAARVAGVSRVVQLSTIAVISDVEYEPVDERHPLFSVTNGCPSGPHGSTKAAAEVMAMTYCSAYGLDVIVCRMAAVYGFGMRLALHIKPMVERAWRGQACVFPAGDMRRDYVYIDDAVQGIVAALYAQSPVLKQRVFNIGSGEITSSQELAAQVKLVLPAADIRISGGMTALEASNSKMRGKLDIGAARSQLGYAPAFDLQRGIAAYAADLEKFETPAPVQ